VKTTLDLPDELVRTVKIRAIRENRKLKDMIAELLQRGLTVESGSRSARMRVQIPLVQTAHQARRGEEMTPDRVAQILLDEETHE
jgi:plasmid stability protein